jgi:acetyl-CoA carboxylase biotin carboxyl carrier protein
MMDADDLHRVVQRLQASDVTAFECEGPGVFLRMRFARGAAQSACDQAPPVPHREEAAAPDSTIKSPGMGHLCLTHPLGAQEALREEARVKAGQAVAFLRAGEVLVPVIAERDAVIRRCVAAEGALVGFGEVLFEVDLDPGNAAIQPRT